jgi:hypothetical protein
VKYLIQDNTLRKSECFRGWHLVAKSIVQNFLIALRVAGGVEIMGILFNPQILCRAETHVNPTFPFYNMEFGNS